MPLPRSAFLLTVALAACGGSEPPPVPPAEPAAAAPPPAPVAAPPQDVMVRGTIRMLPTPMFRSCDASALTPLIDSTGDRIPSLYRATRSNDQDGLYVEGRAKAGTSATVVLKSIELGTSAGDAWGCDRPAPTWQFRATGRNPAWSVTVTSTEITYELPDSALRISFPATAGQDTASFTRYSASTPDGGGHSIHLLLEPVACNIGSSGTWASMQSRLVLDGKPFNGCASRGTQH
jgi:uncharacterized membrane protein